MKERKELIQHRKNNVKTSDLYTCSKCKNSKCITWQI